LLLQTHGWRWVFYFGSLVSFAFLLIVWAWLPETIAFLCHARPARGLERVNRSLERMGHSPVSALPAASRQEELQSAGDIFRPALLATTLLVTFAYFTHIATFYFILKWVPKVVVDMGFAPAAAAGVLVWANVGGATGGALLGFMAQKLPLRAVTVAALIGSVLMVSWFGSGQHNLRQLSLVVAIAGFFTNAGVVGMYALFARVFPTHARATGTGFAIGIGRGGAALSPILAGLLFTSGMGLQTVAIVMASGAGLAAIALLLLPRSAVAETAREALA
jgi:predicted MFS family arabinose efflux permease